MHSPSSYFARTLVAAAFLSLTTSWADSYKGPTPPAVYTQECGSCHLAFPPNLLPKASWQRVMNSLDKHYGSDASLDAATQKQIDTWLQTYGGQGKRAREEPPLDRITRSAWFERKHRELSAATFKRASIKSPANCTACHRDAVQGDFEEDRVRIPK
jgi:hypothetical protein